MKAFLLLVFIRPTLLAQAQSLPQFEVATVKPVRDNRLPEHAPSHDIVRMISTTRAVIGTAYGVGFLEAGRVLKGPDWIDKDTYAFEGKISEAVLAQFEKMSSSDRQGQVRLRWQALLRDRLALKVHLEKRKMPIYKLIVAKGDRNSWVQRKQCQDIRTGQTKGT
jgi:uncharacterized protein (TIGR03435 family)